MDTGSEKIWYYMKNDGSKDKYGPYSDKELSNLISKGILDGNDWIWMPDLSQWMKIGNTIYSFYLTESSEFENDFNI
ncbi:MAG: DUF4339 domain-containing protein [Lactimicrobium sp.]|jgi:hypothetical protein|uniref:DUF4339 domain-containing protein n=1 Tax=Lactimicrobium sp. TaxID=2563780 RepID=UPI002F34F18A